MRATRSVDYRETATHRSLDQWAMLSPDAKPCADDEEQAERERRIVIYAKNVKDGLPIEFIKEQDDE